MQILFDIQSTCNYRRTTFGPTKAKIDCVMERTQNFLADAENEFHFRQIYRDHPIVSLVSKHGDLCENIAFYLVFFICYKLLDTDYKLWDPL